MRILRISLMTSFLLISACGIIPGTGLYAGDEVNRFINTPFTNPSNPNRHPGTGNPYGYSKGWLYGVETEGSGKRYYIRFDYERCKYSLYVDQNDIIRSWRDEGGTSHMNRCLVR